MEQLSIISEDIWMRLQFHLAETGRNCKNDAAIQSCLAPVRLLRQIGKVVPGVFAEEWKAVRAMRMLCIEATDFEIDISNASVLNCFGANEPYVGALINMSNLVVAGIAASMAGMNLVENSEVTHPTQSVSFRKTLDSLARACAAAESICMFPNRTEEILSLFENDGRVLSSRDVAVALFATDPIERARWHCFDMLFNLGTFHSEAINDNYMKWLASRSEYAIITVDPRNALPGEIVRIHLSGIDRLREDQNLTTIRILFISANDEGIHEADMLPDEKESTLCWLEQQFSHFLKRKTVESETVLQLQDSLKKSAFIEKLKQTLGADLGEVSELFTPQWYLTNELINVIYEPALYVRVPDTAQPGWVGVREIDSADKLNNYRQYLGNIWHDVHTPCLNGNGIPIDEYATEFTDTNLPIPAPSAANRFEGGVPFVCARIEQENVAPGELVCFSWISSGATRVDCRINQLADETQIQYEFPANGRKTFAAPNILTTVNIVLTPVVVTDNEELHGEASNLSIEVIRPDSAAVPLSPSPDISPFASMNEPVFLVVFRPAFVAFEITEVAQVPHSEVQDIIDEINNAGTISIETLKLPFIPDELVMLERAPWHDRVAEPSGEEDSVWDLLLKRLCIQTLRSPGLEDALWIAVVPELTRADRVLHKNIIRSTICPTARHVFIVTPEGLRSVLQNISKLPALNTIKADQVYYLRCAFLWYRSGSIAPNGTLDTAECICPVINSINENMLSYENDKRLQLRIERLYEKEFRMETGFRRVWELPDGNEKVSVLGRDKNGFICLHHSLYNIPLSKSVSLICGLIPVNDTITSLELHTAGHNVISETPAASCSNGISIGKTRLLKRFVRVSTRIFLKETAVTVEEITEDTNGHTDGETMIKIMWHTYERLGGLPDIAIEAQVDRSSSGNDTINSDTWMHISSHKAGDAPICFKPHCFNTEQLRLRIVAYKEWEICTWTMPEPLTVTETVRFAIRSMPSTILKKDNRSIYWADMYNGGDEDEKMWLIGGKEIVGSVYSRAYKTYEGEIKKIGIKINGISYKPFQVQRPETRLKKIISPQQWVFK